MDPLKRDDPKSIGPYTLHGRLGEGGMGVVYFGKSRGRYPVAIKVVRFDLAQDSEFRHRFANEVASARKVSGLYTAHVVDADPDATLPWMATIYIPGQTLAEAVVENGVFSDQEVRELGAALAEGLVKIHECGIVHRDLKPSNIVLAADGPKIMDFGVAKNVATASHTTSHADLTKTNAVIGTLPYMSPEQVSQEQLTPQSDIFALGAVLTYAATGHVPFNGLGVTQLADNIRWMPPNLHPLTGDLRDLISACLEKVPSDRPTPTSLIDRLAPSNPPAVVRAPDSASQPTAALAAPRVLVGPSSAVSAPSTPAGGAASTPPSGASSAPSGAKVVPVSRPAPHPQANPPVAPVPAHPSSTSNSGSTTGTPGGGKSVQQPNLPTPPGKHRRWGRAAAIIGVPVVVLGGAYLVLHYAFHVLGPYSSPATGSSATGVVTKTFSAPSAGGVLSVAFRPNGTLAAGNANGSTYLWDTATGKHTMLADTASPKGVYSVAFGPGGVLAAGGDSGNTDLWSKAGKHLATLSDPSSQVVRAVAFGPEHILATDQVRSVDLWDTATDKRVGRLTDPQSSGIFALSFGPDGTLAVGDHNGHTYLWNTATQTITATLTNPASKGVNALAFAPNGTALASGDSNGSAYLWSTATNKITATLTDPERKIKATSVNALAFAPNGTLAVGNDNGSIHLWNTKTNEIALTLANNVGTGVSALAFAPNGTLAVGDDNGSTYLWTITYHGS